MRLFSMLVRIWKAFAADISNLHYLSSDLGRALVPFLSQLGFNGQTYQVTKSDHLHSTSTVPRGLRCAGVESHCGSDTCQFGNDPHGFFPWNDWRQVDGHWWFLGDEPDLTATPESLRPREFQIDHVPKVLRNSHVLQLQAEHHAWTFFSDQILSLDVEAQPEVPLHVCGLPVVALLPRSSARVTWSCVDLFEGTQCNLMDGISFTEARKLWESFPFATGICVWMSGHLQLLAPTLSDLDTSTLVVPSRVAGLEVSISTWSPIPTSGRLARSSGNTDIQMIPDRVTSSPQSPSNESTNNRLSSIQEQTGNSIVSPIQYLALGNNSNMKIGNTVCTAGVKVRRKSGEFYGCNFLSASTHAIFQGNNNGKRLQCRRIHKHLDGLRTRLRKLSRTPSAPAVPIAGVEVFDLYGVKIGAISEKFIYDDHPISPDALFPDAVKHDLCFIGPLPEPSVKFQSRHSELSWFPNNYLPLGCGISILDDPHNCVGKYLNTGFGISRSIRVENGKDTIELTKETVETSILFRRNSKPLLDKGISGATIVTKDDEGKWTRVVGFQSFEFVSSAALNDAEELENERILDDINRGKALKYCICGARPVPSDIKNKMEIVNDRHEL